MRAGMPLVAAEMLRRMGDADQVIRAVQAEAERRRCDWPRNARPDQLVPLGDWIVWLILAGRGWGKTRTGAETVRYWNASGHRYVNLIGATSDDARDIMIEGESGILAICPLPGSMRRICPLGVNRNATALFPTSRDWPIWAYSQCAGSSCPTVRTTAQAMKHRDRVTTIGRLPRCRSNMSSTNIWPKISNSYCKPVRGCDYNWCRR